MIRRWGAAVRVGGVDWAALASAMSAMVDAESTGGVGEAAVDGYRALGAESTAVLLSDRPGGEARVIAATGAGLTRPLPDPLPAVSETEIERGADGSFVCTTTQPVISGVSSVVVSQGSFTGDHDVEEVRLALPSLAAVMASSLSRAASSESARTIGLLLQRQLLPRIDQARTGDAAVRYAPAGADAGVDAGVGGDWYDVIETRDGRTVLVIGDVVGHSVSAAVQMTEIRSALHSHLLEGLPASLALARVNELTVERGGMATCCCVEISAHGVTVTSAGHPPPIIGTPRGHAEIAAVQPGPPLGVVPNAPYGGRSCAVGVGDVVILYSDGLVEADRVSIGDGIERVRRAVANGRVDDLERLASDLLALVAPLDTLRDDVAILAFRLTETILDVQPGGGGSAHVPTGQLAVDAELVWRLFDAAPDATIVTAADGTIVLANRGAETLLGHARSELIGESVELLLPDPLRHGHAESRDHYLAEPTARPMGLGPFTARRRDGHLIWVDVSLSPVRLGDQTYVMSTLRAARAEDPPDATPDGAEAGAGDPEPLGDAAETALVDLRSTPEGSPPRAGTPLPEGASVVGVTAPDGQGRLER
jgi:PAS domain S-box-containing protein